MTRDPRGPQVTLSLSFGATQETAYVREMDEGALYDALNYWRGGMRYVQGGEEAMQFLKLANTQKGRIRRELLRRGLPMLQEMDKCAFCHTPIPDALDVRAANIDGSPVTLCVTCYDDGPYDHGDGIPPREC